MRHVQVGVDAGQAVRRGFGPQERRVLRGTRGLETGERVVFGAVRSCGSRRRAAGWGEQTPGGAEGAAVRVRDALIASHVILRALEFRGHAVGFLNWYRASRFTRCGGISDWTGVSKLVAGCG